MQRRHPEALSVHQKLTGAAKEDAGRYIARTAPVGTDAENNTCKITGRLTPVGRTEGNTLGGGTSATSAALPRKAYVCVYVYVCHRDTISGLVVL